MLLATLALSWHEFFLLIGTASATLVGLMFVAVSITASYMTDQLRPGLGVFLSPTILHLTSILIVCLVLLIPANDLVIGALLCAVTAFAFVYSLRVLGGVWKFLRDPDNRVDGEDHFFYGLAPAGCSALMLAGALLLFCRGSAGPWLLGAGLVALLALCIRNAWDVTVWAVIRVPRE